MHVRAFQPKKGRFLAFRCTIVQIEWKETSHAPGAVDDAAWRRLAVDCELGTQVVRAVRTFASRVALCEARAGQLS
jgi:hypothetical protein